MNVCVCAGACYAARREMSPTPLVYIIIYLLCVGESISLVIYNFGNFCFAALGDGRRGRAVAYDRVGGSLAGEGRGVEQSKSAKKLVSYLLPVINPVPGIQTGALFERVYIVYYIHCS